MNHKYRDNRGITNKTCHCIETPNIYELVYRDIVKMQIKYKFRKLNFFSLKFDL
jgi:hypothetical protein